MLSKIDEIREALGRLSGFTYHAADSQDADDIKTVCAALSAIDPEAIRRAQRMKSLLQSISSWFACWGIATKDDLGQSVEEFDREIAAILDAEPAQDDGEPEEVMTMIENGDLSISWECSGCKGISDDADYIESIEKCPHCGALIRKFVYIEEDDE